jgi:hypothetical protein
MRGKDYRADNLFSYLRLEDRIPMNHPLRAIREIVDAALAELSRAFAKLYARDGRPGIPLNGCCVRSCCRLSLRSARSGS